MPGVGNLPFLLRDQHVKTRPLCHKQLHWFPGFAGYFSKLDHGTIFAMSPLQPAAMDSLFCFWIEAALHF